MPNFSLISGQHGFIPAESVDCIYSLYWALCGFDNLMLGLTLCSPLSVPAASSQSDTSLRPAAADAETPRLTSAAAASHWQLSPGEPQVSSSLLQRCRWRLHTLWLMSFIRKQPEMVWLCRAFILLSMEAAGQWREANLWPPYIKGHEVLRWHWT